jgi:hypothetical protein
MSPGNLLGRVGALRAISELEAKDVDRAEERAQREDVGDQTLIRGLDTAWPFVRLGLSLSNRGHRSGDPAL